MQGLGGRPDRNRQLRRPRQRWENNIKMNIQGMECGPLIGSIWFMVGTGGGLL